MHSHGSMPRSKGIPRREALQIGFSGLLGLGLPQLARANPVSRPKSVLLIFLTGASSHLDTFDLKPESPDGIRGEFKPVATSVPGIQVCEHLPLLAQRAHQYALVRSMAHKENNHLVATHHTLTGHPQPGAFFDKVASRDDWPSYAATLNYLHARGDGLPSGVNLPTFLVEGALTWPGQHAGFIGPRHDPWQITQDPARPGFKVDNLSVSQGLTIGRIRDRAGILKSLDLKQKALEQSPAPGRLREQQEMALAMLGSGKLAQAFDLDQEPVASREKYGRHAFGQSILLARRLLQAGVPVVQANMGRVQNWDTHGENFTRLKNSLLPPLDRGVAALLDDLTATGMIEDTLVIVTGEFGRTPKISFQPGANNSQPGRDHWAQCYTALFAGAGVRGGQVIGRSDKIGAYPATIPYTPDDLGATVYHTLGIDPETHVRDRQNRPSQLNRGKVIEPLFNGSHGA